MANSMLFVVATRLPVAPISRSGLALNILAAIAAWIAFIKGTRPRLPHQLAAIALLSIIHYILLSNVWSVIDFGL